MEDDRAMSRELFPLADDGEDFLLSDEILAEGALILDTKRGLKHTRAGAESDLTDNLDFDFFSDLLQPDENQSKLQTCADTSSTEELVDCTAVTGRPLSASSEIEEVEQQPERDRSLVDRKARRRAQVASSARRTRCRKKSEMIALKTETKLLEQQLETLRSKHKQMRVNNDVAVWEEKAIVQRYKRQQAEQMNDKLRQALYLQSGFIRNLRSMFAVTIPRGIELNMRNFLHTPTHLSKDTNSRVHNLERVCTNAKLDLTMRIILEETKAIKPSTTPVSLRQLDLGREGFGMTTMAVYALETKNAYKTFKATCSAIMDCATVWPNYTLATSSLNSSELPATNLNIRYDMSRNIYECDATGEQVYVETRDVYYYRMSGDCGILLWDYVDADDVNPLQGETVAMRCCIGGVLVRPEICVDGVERIVCHNICTGLHLANLSEGARNLERFSTSRHLCAKARVSLVYETIKSDAAIVAY